MMHSILAVLFIGLFFWSIPVHAKEFTLETPSDAAIIKAIVNAASKTRVRAALLYGLLGQETAYGRNVGKTENEWKQLCSVWSSQDCENWQLYDCKEDYKNARYYDRIIKELGFVDEKEKADKSGIPTSSTCALGFTQFEPDTWHDITKSRGDGKKAYNPWNIEDSILVAAYYLEDLGADATEPLGVNQVITKKDRAALQRYYCGSNYQRWECVEYARGVEMRARRAQNVFLTTDLAKQLELLQQQLPRAEAKKKKTPAYREPGPPVITKFPIPSAFTNIPYLHYIQASEGLYPLSWEIIDGAFPNGITLKKGAGIIEGTPTESGIFAFTIKVTDSKKRSDTEIFIMEIREQVEIIIADLPEGIVGKEYKAELKVKGGMAPHEWNIIYGELPKGLSLDFATGIISGVPKEPTTVGITVKVADKLGTSATQWFNIYIRAIPIVVKTSELPPATVGIPYEETIEVSDGIPPYTMNIEPGGIFPDGLSFDNKTGMIRGIPTIEQYGYFTIKITDSVGTETFAYFNVPVRNPLVIKRKILPEGTVEKSYQHYFEVEGGSYPYVWEIIDGRLPKGFALMVNEFEPGNIVGTPHESGTFAFTIKLTDSAKQEITARMQIIIRDQPVLITGDNSQKSRPKIFERSNGELVALFNVYSYDNQRPAGIYASISHDGGKNWSFPAIVTEGYGGATVIENNNGELLAVVSGSNYGTAPIILMSRDGISWETKYTIQTIKTQNVELNTIIQAANGSYYVAYTENYPLRDIYVVRGNLSEWHEPVRITKGGAVEQSPTLVESNGILYIAYYSQMDNGIVIQKSSDGTTWQKVHTVPSISYVTTGIKFIIVDGIPTLFHSGYDAIYKTELRGGSWLPTRRFSAAPGYGEFDIVSLKDGGFGIVQVIFENNSQNVIFSTVVAGAEMDEEINLPPPAESPLSVPPLFFPNATIGTPYSSYFVVNGGRGPYVWSLAGGSLPPGISFDSEEWSLTGTPQSAGVYEVVIKVTDGSGKEAQTSGKIEVKSPPTITTGELPPATKNVPYNFTLAAEGGIPPYYWYMNTPLPPYLTISFDGIISGAPFQEGVTNVRIGIQDKFGLSAIKSFDMTVNAPVELEATNDVPISAYTQPSSSLPLLYLPLPEVSPIIADQPPTVATTTDMAPTVETTSTTPITQVTLPPEEIIITTSTEPEATSTATTTVMRITDYAFALLWYPLQFIFEIFK